MTTVVFAFHQGMLPLFLNAASAIAKTNLRHPDRRFFWSMRNIKDWNPSLC